MNTEKRTVLLVQLPQIWGGRNPKEWEVEERRRNNLSYFPPQNGLSPVRVFARGLRHLSPTAGGTAVSLLVINPYLGRETPKAHTLSYPAE